jgi:enoyl-CoA hydratase/carnithine racemase
MTATLVLSDDAGPVRVLTMNRPEARNALSTKLIEELYAALCDADVDQSVRALVLTGVDPAFCAGVDLKEAQQLGTVYFEQFQTQSCIRKTAEMATPIIGAINGPVFTGGLEMALGCDFLIASQRAVFADTHARVGILPAGGMTARLPQLVGVAMARRLSMTGEVVDAARAEQIGLVTEVVPHDRLLQRAVELAGANHGRSQADLRHGMGDGHRSGTRGRTEHRRRPGAGPRWTWRPLHRDQRAQSPPDPTSALK